jgi:hypothetical protein
MRFSFGPAGSRSASKFTHLIKLDVIDQSSAGFKRIREGSLTQKTRMRSIEFAADLSFNYNRLRARLTFDQNPQVVPPGVGLFWQLRRPGFLSQLRLEISAVKAV